MESTERNIEVCHKSGIDSFDVKVNGLLNIQHSLGDAIGHYSKWKSPTVIISDGPYGVSGFKGDLHAADKLDSWYEPHIKEWSSMSTPRTTLWFWNTEVGWATVHPVLEKYGWEYKCCNVWNKGKSHIAGNVNTKTIRSLPVVTEVCVQYVKRPIFFVDGEASSMQDWLISEWKRTKLPFRLTNDACKVKNAASRKYFTKDYLWYMPPAAAFDMISKYANLHGDPEGAPFFSTDGLKPMSGEEWELQKSKFYCPFGVTNVWSVSQLRDSERLKEGNRATHYNQKPLSLTEQLIVMSSDCGDVVWDPFGGSATGSVASINTGRACYSSEIDPEMYKIGIERIASQIEKLGQH
ncbi:MAG: site-specific DNA-methyltransferase [Candidatus Methanoplasma sp.]|jgi:site-specific DNA-methyltransferase (adenine-specific)|nr:site-specific DNA-methyltransferase [Candidatus Methanoplasma sp.]